MKKASDMGITGDMTLDQIQTILRKELSSGFICPCCLQVSKLYVRPLTASMAIGLIMMFRATGEHIDDSGYIHIENYFKSISTLPASIRGDLPKLRFWNLIEPDVLLTESEENPNNGRYRLTDYGKQFVQLNKTTQSHVKIYNNKFLGFPDGWKWININDALKKKFNYTSLMRGEL